jgi:hypothetical protein
LIHPALREPHTSSIFQIYGRDDDHEKTLNEKDKLKNWLTNTNAFISLICGPLTLPSPRWGEG